MNKEDIIKGIATIRRTNLVNMFDRKKCYSYFKRIWL